MHVLFRTLGQQQGLQLVRGILPESIDNFINEAAIKLILNILANNTQPNKDTRTFQYTKIGALNSLATLFRTEQVEQNLTNDSDCTIPVSLKNTPVVITNFALNYRDSNTVDCRIIESERLYQTLKDYLNKASYEYPIISLINGNTDKELQLYLSTGGHNKSIGNIIISYIKYPNKVKFDEEHYGDPESDTSVPCDLPEHLHTQVVELAVRIWFESLGLTSERNSNENNKQ